MITCVRFERLAVLAALVLSLFCASGQLASADSLTCAPGAYTDPGGMLQVQTVGLDTSSDVQSLTISPKTHFASHERIGFVISYCTLGSVGNVLFATVVVDKNHPGTTVLTQATNLFHTSDMLQLAYLEIDQVLTDGDYDVVTLFGPGKPGPALTFTVGT